MINTSILIFCWLCFGAGHSIFASNRIKQKFQIVFKTPAHYRLFYNLFSILSLIPILLIHIFDRSEVLFEFPFFFQILTVLLMLKGLIIVVVAFRNYDLLSFIGIREEQKNSTLNTSGINAIMRHPLYTGTIMIAVCLCLLIPQVNIIISAICIATYIGIGTKYEERKLIVQFGQEYIDYKKNIPRFIPNPGDIIRWMFRSF